LGSPVGDSRVVLEQATGRRDRQRDILLCRSLGKKGSFIIMRRLRGSLYGLALMALTGLMANRAEAGSIMLSVDLGGTVIFGPVASVSPDISVTLSTADLASLNGDLASAGSAYRFTQLSANSNFDGGATGFLQINAQIAVGAIGNTTTSLSIDATQGGFLSPLGPNGTILNAVGGSNSNNATGGLTYTGDFQNTLSTPVPITLTGDLGRFSNGNGPTSIGTVPSGYSLSSHLIVNMGDVPTSTLGVTGTTTVTAVPEPASVVMLLTGLPMPLVFMGLLRRRKAKAKA
jgi:hypothetical protein